MGSEMCIRDRTDTDKNELTIKSDYFNDDKIDYDFIEQNLRIDFEQSKSLELSAVTDSESYSQPESRLLSGENLLSIACTNARSLVDKVNSLVTLFDENCLHFALLTETWLTSKACSKRGGPLRHILMAFCSVLTYEAH